MANETQGRVEEILREVGKKIDHLIEETREAKDGVRDELEKKISELKSKKEKLDEEFKHYKQHEKWQEAKEHFSSALHELKKGVEAIFVKKA